jgi:simple sugar transport system ATP-binding protein
MTASQYLLEAIDIVKVFGTLRANDGVTLQVAPGQIHALLGENGAGKSTLVKMFTALCSPPLGRSSGKARCGDSIPMQRASSALAWCSSISHVEALTVVENISQPCPKI